MITKEEELQNISKNYALIPQKQQFNTYHEDLSKYQIFDNRKISKEDLEEYLLFCQEIFPAHEEESGILLSQKLNKMKALKFLHEADYDIIRAKFQLKFPIVFRFASQSNIKLQLSRNQMNSMLNEQIQTNNPQFNQQENEIYYKITEIVQGRDQTNEKVFNELIDMAKIQKVRLPPSVYEIEQNISLYNSQIKEELLQKTPNIQRIKQILSQLSKYPVIPKYYEDLKQKLFSIEQVQFNIDNFETIQEINLTKAFELLDQVERLGIVLDEQNPKQKFFLEFTKEAKKNVELIDIILTNKKQAEKIKMNQLCQVMNFFTRHNIEQNQKLIDLLGYLEKNDRIKENCLMWAEDEKNMDQFPMMNELFQSNIDYQNDVTYVVKKIDAIMIFKEIFSNINNEQELFENIRKIKDYKRKNYKWWRDQIDYMEKICQGLKAVDDKVEEINKLNCSMDQFLFGDEKCLMNYEELKQTVHNKYLINNQSGYYLKIKEFIKDFQNFLQKCLENDCNNKDYFQKINKLLQYSIFKQNEMSLIKNELLIRIKFDCQIYHFFYNVFKKDYEFYFKSFYYYFENQIQNIPDLEHFSKFLEDNYILASKSVFIEQIKLLLERAGLNDLYNKIFNRNIINNNYNTQQSQISINNNFIQNQNFQNSIQESPSIIQQNNHNLYNNNSYNNNHNNSHVKVQESILSEPEQIQQPIQNNILKQNENDIEQYEIWIANLDVFQVYDQNIRKQYPLMQNLENELLCYIDNLDKSNEFNKKNLKNMQTLYNLSQQCPIKIDQKIIDQYQKFVIHTPQKRQSIENYNKFLEIFKIYKKYSNFYQEYKNFKTNRYNFFALKLPLYYIIFYKLRIVGIETNFLNDIQREIQQQEKINQFVQFENKKTINQVLDVFNKLKYLQIYNYKYDFLQRIVQLYLSFEKVIYKIIKKYNSYNFFKTQLQIQNDNEIQNYSIEILIQQIQLQRNQLDILNNLTNFQIQNLNSISNKLYKSQDINIKLHDSILNNNEYKKLCYCGQPCYEDDQQLLTLSPCKTKCHRICLKILLKQQEKRLPCPACKYLEYSDDIDIQNLLTMKLTQSNFVLLYKTYSTLKNYLVNINFVYIEIVFQQLKNLSLKIKNFNNQELENRDNYLHEIALAYILLPVRILSIEKKIFDFLTCGRQLKYQFILLQFFQLIFFFEFTRILIMNKIVMSLLRLAFVGYIGFMTYQTLMSHQKAGKNFVSSLKAFESTTKKRYPNMLPYVQKFSKFVQGNTENFIKYLCYLTLGLCLISLLVCAQTTWVLGLLFVLENVVQRNFASLSMNSNSHDKIGFLLTVAVLGMSFFLSQNCKCTKAQTDNTSNQTKENTNKNKRATTPRRRRTARDQLINQK